MAIKSNLDKHVVTWLKRLDDNGKLNKNISIQRKEVWDVEKKSNLIVSLLLGVPIESLLFEELENESFNVLDGKQRTLTLCAFINGGFALSPKIRVKILDGVQLVGKTFGDLPENMQQQINEYELSISKLRPLNEEDRATVFFMRNQAVALSKMDLSLVMLGQKAMDIFAELCNHDFMQNKIKLTAPARRKHDDLSILLQYLILQIKPDMGFSGNEIMGLCDDIKNGEVILPTDNLVAVLNYLDDAVEEKKRYLKKVHLPIVLNTAQAAVVKKIPPNKFGAALEQFFANLEPNGEYMATCKAGSSKKANVQVRVRIMNEVLDVAEKIVIEPKVSVAKKTELNAIEKKASKGKSIIKK
jgi:hypothetical protein